jgi:hypothetical protein
MCKRVNVRTRESRTLVVVHYISKMIPAAIVRLPHAHRVVRQVDIAVIACPPVLVDFASLMSRLDWETGIR